MGPNLLLIDDDENLLRTLGSRLSEAGFQVETCNNGEQGFHRAMSDDFDLVIADLKMPGRSGFDICREVRYNKISVPFLILSGQDDVMNKIIGLEIGADDYLTKPFDVRELVARIEALLRRANRAAREKTLEKKIIVHKDLSIDRTRLKVMRGQETIALSPTEFRVLEVLAAEPGRVFSRDELRDAVWQYSASSFDHTITTTLHRLRAKIEPNPANPTYIHSVRGIGYRFAELHELQASH